MEICGNPDVPRIGRHALQSDLAGEVDAAILADLPACDAASIRTAVHSARDAPEQTRMTDAEVPRLRVHVAAETRHQRFLQALVPNGWHFVRIECAEAGEELVA